MDIIILNGINAKNTDSVFSVKRKIRTLIRRKNIIIVKDSLLLILFLYIHLKSSKTENKNTILAYGVRNPWGIGLLEEKLYVPDVGRSTYEEVSILNVSDLKRETATTDIDQLSKSMQRFVEGKRLEIKSLTERDSFRKDFIGNVAHELKTPVFSIQGYILTLLDGGLEDEKVNHITVFTCPNTHLTFWDKMCFFMIFAYFRASVWKPFCLFCVLLGSFFAVICFTAFEGLRVTPGNSG